MSSPTMCGPDLPQRHSKKKYVAFIPVCLSTHTSRLVGFVNSHTRVVAISLYLSFSLITQLLKAVDAEDAKEFVPARNAALGKSLAEVIEVEVPDTLITNQAREKYAMMMTEMRDNGVDDATIKAQITPENFLKYKDIVKDDIVRDFKVSLACDEIAREESIEVPDYQVEEQIQNIRKDAQEQGDEDQFDETMMRRKVEQTLQTQLVFDFLADNGEMDVEYVEETFDAELMEKLAEESIAREQKLADEAATE